jgi:endo-alpha-1,4-polygalactosaminidase (GH114 family)
MKKNLTISLFILVSAFFYACGGDSGISYTIKPLLLSDSFDWRLDNVDSSTPLDANVIDVDAFETSKESIEEWHKKGMKVIAYISVGTQDATRSDASLFPKNIIGNGYPNYPDESFIDIRNIDVIAPIVKKRFDMIQEKGFDGIEPDNMDLYVWDLNGKNVTGFSITQKQAQAYIDFLIDEAHKRGLNIGQKNANELSSLYVNKFDWVLAEGAFENDIYDDLKVYITKNKPVFTVEYTDNTDEVEFDTKFCPLAKKENFYAILKNRDLHEYIHTCP